MRCTSYETSVAADEQDRALVRAFLEGDPKGEAAAGLVDRYERRVFTIALRMLGNVQDAEDVTQAVFCNVFASMQSYDPQYRVFSWIYRMTVNESLNHLKRRKPMVTLDERSSIPASAAAADDAVEAEDLVARAMMDLTTNDRAVVVLRHFRFLSYEEIASVLEVPVRTVKSRLFTARERLRVALLAHI